MQFLIQKFLLELSDICQDYDPEYYIEYEELNFEFKIIKSKIINL